MGPMPVSLSFHVFFTHLFDISFEGALNGITNMNAMSILSSFFRCEESDADKLPAVGLPGGPCSTTFFHRLSIDKFNALQNGPPNSSQQIPTLTTLRNEMT